MESGQIALDFGISRGVTARQGRRYQGLPKRGLITLALLANALIGAVSYLALAITLAWSARRSWRHRRLGVLPAVRPGLNPGLVCAVAAHVGWRMALAWANQMAEDGRAVPGLSGLTSAGLCWIWRAGCRLPWPTGFCCCIVISSGVSSWLGIAPVARCRRHPPVRTPRNRRKTGQRNKRSP